MEVPAVAAFPHDDLVLLEHGAVLDVGEERPVSLFVGALDLAHALEEVGNLVEALLAGGLLELLVHVGVLIVLAVGRVFEVGHGIRHGTVVEGLEPQLGVLLLVLRGLKEYVGDLLVSFL